MTLGGALLAMGLLALTLRGTSPVAPDRNPRPTSRAAAGRTGMPRSRR